MTYERILGMMMAGVVVLRGSLERLVQQYEADNTASWIHAVLHMIEGDSDNSRYWYRRAGKLERFSDKPSTELAAIKVELMGRSNEGSGSSLLPYSWCRVGLGRIASTAPKVEDFTKKLRRFIGFMNHNYHCLQILASLSFGEGSASLRQVVSGLWQEKIQDSFYGSPIWAEGKLYCISKSGVLYVLGVVPQPKLLSTIALGEPSFSTPAVAGGILYLRTESRLFSMGGRR